MTGRGPLALVGGAEWTPGCDFDADLLADAGTDVVTVLPTAAAYERPDLVVERARSWFEGLGARVEVVEVTTRGDAHAAAPVAVARAARFLYVAGGSPMHLLATLRHTPLWDAIVAGHDDGAVVAAAGLSAAVLCDAMVDPRGGGFGVGLGLTDQLTLIPGYDRWSAEKSRRTLQLAPRGLVVAGIPDRTALVRDRSGAWTVSGAGDVRLFRDGEPVGTDELTGRR